MRIPQYNQDGLLDILVGNSGEPNAIYRNTGDGKQYERMALSQQNYKTYDIQLVDLNADQYLDVIEVNSDEVNVYYFNIFPRMKKKE
ncbi:MAG: VCBS repeat-containing protein [Bacteroidota bacterium]